MDLKTREGRREQGDLIKAAAAAAGLTLKELSNRLGVSHALIYQYVSGANLAQPDKLQEIALVTGYPISYFFGESTGETAPVPIESPAAQAPIERPTAPALESPAVDITRVQQTLRQLDQLSRAQDQPGRDLAGLLRTLEQMLGLARLTGEQRTQADLLLRIGNARTDSGDLGSASEALEECLALNRDLHDSENALHATQSLARCQSLMGRTDEAEALFREVAASADPAIAWRGLLGLGQIMEQRDLYEEALSDYERARDAVDRLPASKDATRRIAEIYVRTNLGNVYMAEGDFAAALPLWQENLDDCEDRSQPDQFLEALLSEGVCQLHLGRPGAAFDLCRRAIRLCRLLGDRERLAVGRACLSEAMAAAGLGEEGKEQAREAAKLSSEVGTSRGVSWANLALARNLIWLGQQEQARFCLDTEIASSSPKIRAAALLLRSDLWLRDGETANAEADARQALEALRDRGALHLEKVAWAMLSRAGAARGDVALIDEGLAHAAALDRQTPGLPDTPWMIEAARGALHRLRGNLVEAAASYRAAVQTLQASRADLGAHGVIEASLDDPEKLRVYQEAIRISREAQEPGAADAILAEAAWPPLTEASEPG